MGTAFASLCKTAHLQSVEDTKRHRVLNNDLLLTVLFPELRDHQKCPFSTSSASFIHLEKNSEPENSHMFL